MQLEIPVELQPLIDEQMASGRFDSPVHVVREGLRLLREQSRDLDAFKQQLQSRLDRLNRGDGIDLQYGEELTRFFDDVKARGRKQLETPVESK